MKTKHLFIALLLGLQSHNTWAQEKNNLNASLTDLFAIADSQNRDLKILDNLQKIAEASIKEEKEKLLPNVNATLTFSYNGNGWISDRNFSNGFSVPIPHYGNNFALEAQQLIYAGGAAKSAIELARLNHESSILDSDKARQNIRLGITGYYLEMQKLNNQKIVIERNIAQTKRMIDQIKAKTNQGVALKNNITRYELQLQSLNINLLQLNNGIKIINNDLVNLLQLPNETTITPQSEIESNEMQNWLNLAKNDSPELKQATLQIEQAKKHEDLVKSEKLPQVFAFASNYLNGPITIEIPAINKNFNYWYVGVGLKYDLSTLYKNQTKASKANLMTRNSEEAQQKTIDELATKISSAEIKYNETLEVYQTRLKSIELANQNYTVVRNRYLNDLSLITEMLDAENAKIDAELQAENAKINILFHYYQLKKLTGTL